MMICIASDHAGYEYKTEIVKHLASKGHEVPDCGTDSNESVDYPDFIKPAAKLVSLGSAEICIVLGGSRNGEAIAANKISGIRCAVCWNEESAKLAKEHNNANMISIGKGWLPLKKLYKLWMRGSTRHSRGIATYPE